MSSSSRESARAALRQISLTLHELRTAYEAEEIATGACSACALRSAELARDPRECWRCEGRPVDAERRKTLEAWKEIAARCRLLINAQPRSLINLSRNLGRSVSEVFRMMWGTADPASLLAFLVREEE